MVGVNVNTDSLGVERNCQVADASRHRSGRDRRKSLPSGKEIDKKERLKLSVNFSDFLIAPASRNVE